MPPMTQRLVAAVVAFVLVLCGMGYGIYAKTEENAEVETKVEELKKQIAVYDATIATRETKRKQREQQEEVFRELVSILPPFDPHEKQAEKVMEAITQFGSQAKLKFKGEVVSLGDRPSVRGPGSPPPPPPAPGGAGGGDFVQTTLTVKFEGTYANFVKFLSLIENNESFLKVQTFSVIPQPLGDGPQPAERDCNVTVQVVTYQYAPK